MTGLESLPPELLFLAFAILAAERLWKAHTERRDKTSAAQAQAAKEKDGADRSWQDEMRDDFTRQLNTAILKSDADCAAKMELIRSGMQSEIDGLKNRQAELLLSLTDAGRWEHRYWRARERAIAAGVPASEMDELWKPGAEL